MAAAFLVPAEGLPKELPAARMQASAPVAAYGAPSEPGFFEPPSVPVGAPAVQVSAVRIEAGSEAMAPAVELALRRVMPARAAHCYRVAGSVMQGRSAALRMRAEVAPSGRPRSVTITSAARGDVFERCVTLAARSLVLPRPRGGLTVSFVLRVSAPR